MTRYYAKKPTKVRTIKTIRKKNPTKIERLSFLVVGIFFGVLISPLWSLLEKEKPKSDKIIYDRQNPKHGHLFKGYPKYKGRYIEVPKSQKDKQKFWKEFRKEYFNK